MSGASLTRSNWKLQAMSAGGWWYIIKTLPDEMIRATPQALQRSIWFGLPNHCKCHASVANTFLKTNPSSAAIQALCVQIATFQCHFHPQNHVKERLSNKG